MHNTLILYNSCIVKLSSSLSNKGLLEECDKEENVEVTGAATTSSLKRRLKCLSNVSYSPSHRQAGTPMINILSTLRTALDV
jgi:hypothetical protein